jgi:hypothetical protein
MMIIGCDFHPSWQQVSWLDIETGETGKQKLVQAAGDGDGFIGQVAAQSLGPSTSLAKPCGAHAPPGTTMLLTTPSLLPRGTLQRPTKRRTTTLLSGTTSKCTDG